MHVLITYDVSDKHSEIIKAMRAKGYANTWSSDKVPYNLPESTLWNNDKTVAEAVKDLQDIVSELDVELKRCMAVPANPWAGITGDRID
jgi:hypothetical protein